jgi:hypothetical protein
MTLWTRDGDEEQEAPFSVRGGVRKTKAETPVPIKIGADAYVSIKFGPLILRRSQLLLSCKAAG